MIRKLWLIVLISAIAVLLSAQSELSIYTNQPFYTTGEQIGVVVTNMSHDGDEMIYLELLSQDRILIDSKTVRSKEGACASIFNIPLSISSDWYIVRAYNIWTPSLTIKDLGYKVVAIYNEFEAVDRASSDALSIPESSSFSDNITIRTNEDSYQKSEIVEVSIGFGEGDRTDDHYVASVVHGHTYQLIRSFERTMPQAPQFSLAARPDNNQKSDKLVNVGTLSGDVNDVLGAIYIAEDKTFSWVSLADDNTFGFELDDFEGKKTVQFIGMEPLGGIRYFDAAAASLSKLIEWPIFNLESLPYPPELLKYLEASQKRKIIMDIFSIDNDEAEFELGSDKTFIKADKTYAPRDFIRFSDTRDFINEVVSFLKLRRDGDDPIYRVLLERNKLGTGHPLLFLNGHMVSNIVELLNIELTKIERIDLYRKENSLNAQFSSFGKSGVVAFYTKDATIRPVSSAPISIDGLENGQPIIDPDVTGNLPHFTPLLYWNGSMESDDIVNFSFDVSDDKGVYIIEVIRYSDEGITSATKKINLEGKDHSN